MSVRNLNFTYFCRYGNLEKAKECYVENLNIKDGFREACIGGNLEIVRWLYSLDPSILNDNFARCFQFACSSGHLKIVRWIHILKPEVLNDIEINHSICRSFKICKWLYSKIHDNEISKYGFENACDRGDFEVAKWFYSKNPKVIEYKTLENFRSVCCYGNTEFLKWYLNLRPEIDVTSFKFDIFATVCAYGNLENAKYIYSLNKTFDLEHALSNACIHNRLVVAEWIYSICPSISITEEMFQRAYRFESVDTMKWILEKNPNIDLVEYFKDACREKFLDAATCLRKLNSTFWFHQAGGIIKNWSVCPHNAVKHKHSKCDTCIESKK